MNDSPSLLDAIMPLILLGIGYWLWYLAKGSYAPPRRRNVRAGSLASLSAPNTPSAPPALQGGGGPPPLYRPRAYQAVALNPCDHPYDELSLTDLHDHLFNRHFETWNVTVGRDRVGGSWRREHAADHGLVMGRG